MEAFFTFIKFEIGDGQYDRFCMIGGIENREVILHEAFPALFNIAQDIEAFVGDFMHGNNGTMLWYITFIRPIKDWELETLKSFFYPSLPLQSWKG